jgi:lipopolysaccharide transport system permease protein
VVVFAVIIIYGGHISLDAGLRFMVGFIMLWFVLVNVCLILALIGARYRDVGPIIENLTTIIYYVTPIIWMPKQIPHEYEFIYELNPVYNLIELLRAPLMGWEVSNGAYLYAMWILILTTILASYLSGKYKNRIAYWI